MPSCTLTVFFDEPFWVGLVERQDGDSYAVARHVFGAEPSMPQVERFVQRQLGTLAFAESQVDAGAAASQRINPKRLQRIAKKEMEKNPLSGTRAQRVLSAQREVAAGERKEVSKRRKQEEKDERFEQRSAKRKEKHRGH